MATTGPAAKKTTTPPPVDPGMITTRQMRELHAALRDHGITGDVTTHEYLALALGRDLTTRTSITVVEAAGLIADLQHTDPPAPTGPSAAKWAALSAPFPTDQIEKLPKVMRRDDADKGRCEPGSRYSADGHYCGNYHARAMHLDYVGHAGITMRLNDVLGPDGWHWEPFSLGMEGLPLWRNNEFWIRLHIGPHTRIGVGDDSPSPKVLIGDALRNAAMRFGVGTYLWSKSEVAHAMRDTPPESVAPPVSQVPAGQQWVGTQNDPPWPLPGNPVEFPPVEVLLIEVGRLAQVAGVEYEAFTAKWRTANGDLTLDQFEALPPEDLHRFVKGMQDYLAAKA